MASPEEEMRLSQRAQSLMQAGRIEEAIKAYRDLLKTNPALPDAWYNLGYLYRCNRRFPDAVQAYRRALALHIDRPEEVRLNLAAILSEHLDDTDGAQAELEAALSETPRFVPALLNLGNLHEDVGRPERAVDAYSRVLAIAPDNGRAIGRIAMIDVFGGDAEGAARRLEEILEKRVSTLDDPAEILFALAHALDALGNYDRAFDGLVAANRARFEALPDEMRYNPEAQERMVDQLIACFPAPPGAVSGEGDESPIFVCGMFRSGSTLAEQILASHSRVTAGGEFEYLPALVFEKLQPYPQSMRSISGENIASLRARYLDDLSLVHPQYDHITDKRPDNFIHIGLIKTIFPEARIIHTLRHPLDNILSIFFGNFDDSISYSWRLEHIVHWYGQYRRLMEHWKSLYPADILDLDYDALVATPEPVTRQLVGFCGLDWEEACLSRSTAASTVRTLSAWQVRQPLHARSSGRWRNYAARLRQAGVDTGPA